MTNSGIINGTYYSLAKAASLLGITERRVYQLIEEEKFGRYKYHRQRVLLKTEVDAEVLKRNSVVPEEAA